MTDLQTFDNETFGSVRVLYEDDKPLFCGADVSKALGYTNPRKAVNDHCKGVTKRYALTDGGRQSINFIPEGDVYRLITHSKLPAAEKFERWVFDEVLPTLRKTGSYTTASPDTAIAAKRANVMEMNAKTRRAAQMLHLWTAAGVAPVYQALAMQGYYEGLMLPREALKDKAPALLDATTIAQHLGVQSESGRPHALAVSAIISKHVTLAEGEMQMTPYSHNGHDGVSAQYTPSVEDKVSNWLSENGYPKAITCVSGKTFRVNYVQSAQNV